jgi:ferredoxin-like protein FixX
LNPAAGNSGRQAQEAFVWWRVAPEHAAAAADAVLRVQAELETACPGLRAKLYRRAEAGASHVTLMECYACGADGVGPELSGRIDQAVGAVLARHGSPERHVERFEPVTR